MKDFLGFITLDITLGQFLAIISIVVSLNVLNQLTNNIAKRIYNSLIPKSKKLIKNENGFLGSDDSRCSGHKEIKAELAEGHTKFGKMEQQIEDVKEDISGVKEDISEVKGHVQSVDTKVDTVIALVKKD